MSARRISTLAAVTLLAASALLGCTAPGPAEPSAESDPAPDEPITTEVGGDCLVGDWVISEDQLNAFYAQVSAESEGVTMSVEGNTALNFTETTYEYLPVFTLFLDMAGTSGSGDVTGSVRGDYTASEGVLTTENDVSALDMQLTIDGMPFDGSDLGNEIIASQPINDVTYRCEAGAPVIDFKTATSTIPLTLTAG